jgi:hypothetical protein
MLRDTSREDAAARCLLVLGKLEISMLTDKR